MFRAAAIMIAWLPESELSKSHQPCFVYNHCYAPLIYNCGVHKTAYIIGGTTRQRNTKAAQDGARLANVEVHPKANISL